MARFYTQIAAHAQVNDEGLALQMDEDVFAAPPQAADGLSGQAGVEFLYRWCGQGARPQDGGTLDRLAGQGRAQGTDDGFNFGQFRQGLLVEHGADAAAFMGAQDDFSQQLGNG